MKENNDKTVSWVFALTVVILLVTASYLVKDSASVSSLYNLR